MHYSIRCSIHCDGCSTEGLARLHRRLMPDGSWKEDLVPPDGWEGAMFKPPPVVEVQRQRPSALMSASQIAALTNADQPGMCCRVCATKAKAMPQAGLFTGGE
jgi:hypothetical protein